MALLFMDSFDHYGTGGDPAALGKWATITVGSVNNTNSRTGTFSLRFSASSGEITSKPLTVSGGFVVGVAIYNTTSFNTNNDIIQIQEGSTVQLAVSITNTGLLQVKRSTTVLQTGTKVLNINSWYYIEFKGTIHDSTGSYELRIDGVTELSATGVDTLSSGTNWNCVSFGALSGNLSYIDDVYICDTSGAAPRNTFLGLIKIECLLPQTDAVSAGTDRGFTPSTGTDHGALVDEVPPNTTDYNFSSIVSKESYQFPAMTLSGTVLGLQTNLFVSKSDSSPRVVCATIRMPITDYDGASVNPTTSFTYLTEIRPVNPFTSGEWTVADVNSAQAGMKVVS